MSYNIFNLPGDVKVNIKEYLCPSKKQLEEWKNEHHIKHRHSLKWLTFTRENWEGHDHIDVTLYKNKFGYNFPNYFWGWYCYKGWDEEDHPKNCKKFLYPL